MIPDQDVTAHGAVVAGLAHQKGDHHCTTLAGHTESLSLQSNGGMNEHKVLYQPQPLTQGGTDPQDPRPVPLHPPPLHQAPGLTSASCHPLSRCPQGRRMCALGALSW